MKKPNWEIRTLDGRSRVASWLHYMLDSAPSPSATEESYREWYLSSQRTAHGFGSAIRRLRAGKGTIDDQMLAASYIARSLLPKRLGNKCETITRPPPNPAFVTALRDMKALRQLIWEQYGRDDEVLDFVYECVVDRNIREWLHYENQTTGSLFEDFLSDTKTERGGHEVSDGHRSPRKELMRMLDRELGLS